MSSMRQLFTPQRGHKGLRRAFTIGEMIIAVAVLAILVGISSPVILHMMRQNEVQNEQNALDRINKALQTYRVEKRRTPNGATWAEELQPYLGWSLAQVQNDTWGTPRAYTKAIAPLDQGDTRLLINYTSVMSAGPDRRAAPNPGVSVVGGAFGPPTHAEWWSHMESNPPQPADRLAMQQAFAALKAAGDDLLVTYTDHDTQLAAAQKTSKRLDRIVKALEFYARSRYANEMRRCQDNPTDSGCANGRIHSQIYYPRSIPVDSTGANTDDNGNYFDPRIDYDYTVNNQASSDTRRRQMQALMRHLGLPEEYCCAASLDREGDEAATDDDSSPFFYFSNPRPRLPAPTLCGDRPDPTSNQRMPARVTTNNNDRTCG